MKEALPSAGLMVSLFLAGLPGYSFSEVQISLKNEASVIADECREETDRLVCFKMGGTFEIEKRDVLSMKNIPVRRSPVPDTRGPDAVSGISVPLVKAGDKADGALPAGEAPDSANSAAPFAQNRLALQAERESLLRERQQIQDDIKSAPDWMSTKQFNELTRRNAELDARIKRFNEEASWFSEQMKQAVPDVRK